MPALEQRRVVNQPAHGTMPSEADRLFAEAIRRLLLKAISMIEDRYRLRPINPERQPAHQR
jgi:hypothetical protein